jgi:hypothetical protein
VILAQCEAEFLGRGFDTRTPSGTTSLPMPSPGMTAML